MSIRVALADRQPIFLYGLEKLLEREPGVEVVARSTNGEEILQAVRSLLPDLLILDLHLAGLGGLPLLRAMRAEGVATRAVLLTAEIAESEVLEALRLGVQGVVLKEMEPRLLIQCLRKVHAGERWLERRSTARALDTVLRQVAGGREAAHVLTPRELDVVLGVAAGLHNKEIATELAVCEGTVKAHVHNIYGKLNLSSRVALARWAEERGLA